MIASARVLISVFHSAASFGCVFQNGGSGAPMMRLLLRADAGGRHREHLCRGLANAGFERECGSRHGKTEHEHGEMQFDAFLHWSPP